MNALNPQSDSSPSFLQQAVSCSLKAMRQAGVREPEGMDATLIVPAEEDASAWFAKMRRAVLARTAVGFGMMGLGIAVPLIIWIQTSVSGQSPSFFKLPLEVLLGVLFVVLFFGGLTVFGTGASMLRKRTRQAMTAKMQLWQDVMPNAPQMCVNLEDAASFDKLKVLADDYAVAWFDVDGQRVVIEGLRHRYFILREDVMAMRIVTQAGSSGVEVTFLIKPDCLVKMVVIGSSTREEVSRHLSGQDHGSSELADHLRSALGWPSPQRM